MTKTNHHHSKLGASRIKRQSGGGGNARQEGGCPHQGQEIKATAQRGQRVVLYPGKGSGEGLRSVQRHKIKHFVTMYHANYHVKSVSYYIHI